MPTRLSPVFGANCSRPAARLLRGLWWLFALVTLAAALAPWLGLDDMRWALLLTYPPRLLLAGAALAGALVAGWALRQRAGVLLWVLAALLAVGQLNVPWPWRAQPPLAVAEAAARARLEILSFNTAHLPGGAQAFAQWLALPPAGPWPDVLLLQEVDPHERPELVRHLGERYEFVIPDTSARFAHDNWGPFSNLIALRRDRAFKVLARHPAITEYRTFAVTLSAPGLQAFHLVNVHTTKVFWSHDGLHGAVVKADMKSGWHVRERAQLADWLASHASEPVIVSGDFNAPAASQGVRLEGLASAQQVAGTGLGLSWHARVPVWDIDHTLGNAAVRFLEYRLLDTAFSDHRAQRFSVSLPTAAHHSSR